MEENKFVEKFDPQKMMEGVKDRIKATFVSLIPDEAWNQMVEKEIYVFTTGTIEVKCDTDFTKKDDNGNYIIKTYEVRTPYSGKTIVDNWGNKKGEDISPLQKMIRESLHAKFEHDLKEYLDSDAYRSVYDQYGNAQVSEAVEKILIKNADTIFRGFLESIMQSGFDKMRVSLLSNNHY